MKFDQAPGGKVENALADLDAQFGSKKKTPISESKPPVSMEEVAQKQKVKEAEIAGIKADIEGRLEPRDSKIEEPKKEKSQEEINASNAKFELLRSKRIELRNQLYKKLESIIGFDVGAMDRDEELPQDLFKGVSKINEIFKSSQGDLKLAVEQMQKLEVPLMLRFGTLGKVKDFFTKDSIVADLINVDEEYDRMMGTA